MGSSEKGVPLKKNHNLGRLPSSSSSRADRPGLRFFRLLLPKRLGYPQLIFSIVVFSLSFLLFHAFFLGSIEERSDNARGDWELASAHLNYLKYIGGLDCFDDLSVKPSRVGAKLIESFDSKVSAWPEGGRGFGYRKPQIALAFGDLEVDSEQRLMAAVAAGLLRIGYAVEVLSLKGGPSYNIWRRMGIPVTIIHANDCSGLLVDWLNYDAFLVNSLEAKVFLSCLVQEPFKSLPIIWTIYENSLASHVNQSSLSGKAESSLKTIFSRATVVVFPNYALPVIYSSFDAGNYHVIPGTPLEACEANGKVLQAEEHLHEEAGGGRDDFAIAIVGSQFSCKGFWVERALVLQALKPWIAEFVSETNSSSALKILIFTGESNSNHTLAVEAISSSLQYPRDVIKHISGNANEDDILRMADIVIYASFLEEEIFPDILVKSMCLGKPVIAPELDMTGLAPVDDGVNGFLFPKENVNALTSIMSEAVSRKHLSPLALGVARAGKQTGRNLMIREAVSRYARLLDGIVGSPWGESSLLMDWEWNISEYACELDGSWEEEEEEEENQEPEEKEGASGVDGEFVYDIWEEENEIQMADAIKEREEAELEDRREQPWDTWENVYRNARKAGRSKKSHERDDGEIERTGQPLCIYEPYFGEGIWPFLHRSSLYRGVSLGTRGRRHGSDDIDASSRLAIVRDPYYRDVLGEFGAFFAIANGTDRIHKNSWIGFQSWRGTANKAALSKTAERGLLDAIQSQRHGDALYFWMRMELDPRSPSKHDFWSFCDSINVGKCRRVFSDSFKRMYGVEHDGNTTVPPMPVDGDTWSVMHCWALPTRSFMEFVMFARMFADAMDAHMYDEHHLSGRCPLSMSKDKQCYSRVLELLVNVWAYHSARRMVYINPETGAMREQHMLRRRSGQMWVNWFSYPTLKSMDEDLAEEADSDDRRTRWLWPLTGEVYWEGVLDKERNLRNERREKRRRDMKARMARMRQREHQQKPIGKYVKPNRTEPNPLGQNVLPSDSHSL